MKKAALLVLSGFLTIFMVARSNTEMQSGSSDAPSLNSEADLVETVDSMAEEPTENGNDIISEQYEIGDIILADGSIVKESDLTTVDSSNVPIAAEEIRLINIIMRHEASHCIDNGMCIQRFHGVSVAYR